MKHNLEMYTERHNVLKAFTGRGILIAVSLKLTYEETQSLLGTAGYTLTHSNKFDLIVEFFIREGNYDVFEINEMLEHFRQPLLTKCE